VTVSPIPDTPRPSFFDMTGRAKWDAWSNAGKRYRSVVEAEEKYLEISRGLGWSEDLDPKDFEESSKEIKNSDSNYGTTGFGLSVSAPLQPEEQPDDSVHGLAVSGKYDALETLLGADTGIDINALDEYVRRRDRT
jgi:hypothetical protein